MAFMSKESFAQLSNRKHNEYMDRFSTSNYEVPFPEYLLEDIDYLGTASKNTINHKYRIPFIYPILWLVVWYSDNINGGRFNTYPFYFFVFILFEHDGKYNNRKEL